MTDPSFNSSLGIKQTDVMPAITVSKRPGFPFRHRLKGKKIFSSDIFLEPNNVKRQLKISAAEPTTG